MNKLLISLVILAASTTYAVAWDVQSQRNMFGGFDYYDYRYGLGSAAQDNAAAVRNIQDTMWLLQQQRQFNRRAEQIDRQLDMMEWQLRQQQLGNPRANWGMDR